MNREIQHSEDFIRNISKDNKGFSVPENYFDSVEDAVLSEVITAGFPKYHALDVPSNYFKNFEDTLFSKIEFPEKEVKVISLKSRILQFIPTAAAAAILLFVGINYFSIESSSIENLSTDELEVWIEEKNFDYMNTSSSIEFVDADFIESTILDEDDSSIQDEDILEYLNTMDSSSLLTEIES